MAKRKKKAAKKVTEKVATKKTVKKAPAKKKAPPKPEYPERVSLAANVASIAYFEFTQTLAPDFQPLAARISAGERFDPRAFWCNEFTHLPGLEEAPMIDARLVLVNLYAALGIGLTPVRGG